MGRGIKFCSQGCYKKQPYSEDRKKAIGDSLRGKEKPPRSDEHKRRLSESKSGEKHPFWGKKGILCHNFGRKRSKKTRIKHSLSIRGENAPNWQGGKLLVSEIIRKCVEYKLWREDVLKRDGWECQECHEVGGRLNADHKKPFAVIIKEEKITRLEDIKPESQLWDVNNGRTLCVDCHKETKTFGYGTSLILKTL